MLQRRSLPIVEECPLATAVQPVADGVGWCEHCRLHVHDLSARTEIEARMLLRGRGRGRVCVAYRTHADGTIAFREQAKRFAFSTAIAVLVACTGHAPTDVAPELVCRDADGREQLCPAPVEPTPLVQERPPPIPPPPADGVPAGGLGLSGTGIGGGVLGFDDEDVWGSLAVAPGSTPAKPARTSRRARRSRR